MSLTMLASRARHIARPGPSRLLASPAAAARRSFADQPNPPPPSPPPSVAPAAAHKSSEYHPVIPIPKQRGPRKLQDGYSGGFYLSLLGGLLVATPVITYFYWEHRKAHMTSKKEAILKDIQTRAGVA